MPHDSLFGERIVWSGTPKVTEAPPVLRAAGFLAYLLAAVSTAYAVVVALGLGQSPGALLVFGLWCASLGLACHRLPRHWLAKVEYIVTDHHVIWKRGPFRRSIERRAISYARIFWSPAHPNVGDLELVRAVPTGALRRRLLLRLTGVVAADRVWAIVRGEHEAAPPGHGERPLAQRLDLDERVLWSASGRRTLRGYMPHGRREWTLLGLGAVLGAVSAQIVWSGVPAVSKVVEAGLPLGSAAFIALVFALTTSFLLVLGVAAYLVYDAVIRPGLSASGTRYLITNKRVLIQRAREELHLDRRAIVDVIDAPAGNGLTDLFIVLDGPRARALAASGAFGESERGPHLRPVFECIEDSESASRILRSSPDLRHAA
jgi:hypothetical protein